jgi:hypothetical protein
MDNRQKGEELNQLSRLLFDAAANKWYGAIGLEVVAGLLAVMIGLIEPSGDRAFVGAVIVTLLLIIAYALRLWFDNQYDRAETMRRQSVLSEGLNWPVDTTQMSEWRTKAGQRVRSRLQPQPRDPIYYATEEEPGPEHLAEMTIESAFYTRRLYDKVRFWAWIIFAAAALASLFVITILLTTVVPDSVDLVAARAVYSFVPIVIAVDVFGWALRLGRLISAIQSVEAGLQQLVEANNAELPEVLRWVSEYNCQVVQGIPILNWLFWRWHGEIADLWSERTETTTSS